MAIKKIKPEPNPHPLPLKTFEDIKADLIEAVARMQGTDSTAIYIDTRGLPYMYQKDANGTTVLAWFTKTYPDMKYIVHVNRLALWHYEGVKNH